MQTARGYPSRFNMQKNRILPVARGNNRENGKILILD